MCFVAAYWIKFDGKKAVEFLQTNLETVFKFYLNFILVSINSEILQRNMQEVPKSLPPEFLFATMPTSYTNEVPTQNQGKKFFSSAGDWTQGLCTDLQP